MNNTNGTVAADATTLDVREVAIICKCCEAHVRRLVNRGEFPAPVRLGTLVRWDRQTVLAWIAANTGQAIRGGKLVQVRG